MFNAAHHHRYSGFAQGVLLRIFVLVGLQATVSIADAAVVINAAEVGGDVVFTGSGTLDTTGLTKDITGGYASILVPAQGIFVSTTGTMDFYFINGPLVAFGSSLGTAASSQTGDSLGVLNSGGQNYFLVPTGYGGSALAFSSTYSGQNMTSLGLTPGTYQWTLPSDTVTLNVGAAVVPEPTTYIAMAGFAGLGVFVWRRRSARSKKAQ
ncbi:PEP-CTERM sorting domain-containing protein [Cerasicoccus fimbriatus]|uniref:PEP-CTERM sorting domain-containing protein n=1 Tax=Cerasicoccus fimbriatus TaxID=3014554 RepID=UPI0022B5BD42|nr:PEP-CTERM sorting domain-containing protein [Cerasicoccus sp. TK19100]